MTTPPSVILKELGKVDKSDASDEISKMEELGFKNGRYNTSIITHDILDALDHKKSQLLNSEPEPELSLEDNMASSAASSSSCSESEAEIEENNRKMALFEPTQSETQKQKQATVADFSRTSSEHSMADTDNSPGGGKHNPPKDFVCPITSHIFDDPVTLETGQTYERRAIQEWLQRGNSTCPITRQKLNCTQLPKTNYVLKRLIATWKEQNPAGLVYIPPETQQKRTEPGLESKKVPSSTSPDSVVIQTTIDGTSSELRLAITNLCMSEISNESEMAVLQIERFWQEAAVEFDIQSMLSKPPVINGLVGILLNSADPLVLKATIFLLSELGSRDKGVIRTLTRADSDVERIVALFKKGLLEAVVLIYLLRPSAMNLLEMDMVESLLTVIKKKRGCEDSIISSIANAIISTKVIENIIDSLQAEQRERIVAVGILLKCMLEDGKCRNTVAEKAELAPVLDSFLSASDGERFEIVQFLYEIVKLNRRTFNEQILHIIKNGGTFSTTHIFLNYLQVTLPDQSPVVAGLLLQLDLLAEPRKMSIYREEAIESLISSLRNSEFPAAQIAAAETIVSLQGRFTVSGKSLTRSFLLKQAGFGKPYSNLMRMEQPGKLPGEVEENLEEERAAEEWERRMAFALVSYDFGLLFEALAEGLRSRCTELRSACFVSATWLVHMLGILPDTGIRSAARVCFLKLLIEIFTSSEDVENKVLSLLALNSFIKDPEGLHDLTSSMKDIKKDLRELRKSSSLAFEILKVLSAGHDFSTAELWTHNELVQVDCSENGEVLSIAFYNDKIFSGHSDGTIKVWTGKGSILHLIQEIREHTKAVTSLAVLQPGEKLYSGSLDRTERVWSVGNESLTCVQVHDMKDQVNNLVVANGISCFIPQGAGVKVHSWNGGSKLLNPNKHVKCLSLAHGKLYCGCHDSSIQEIDLTTGTAATIQHGSRKLLGKANPIHAIQVQNGLVYSASSPLDGAAVKIWNASNYDLVGSLSSILEVRCMAISSDLIYMGCKGGSVEIWDRKKQQSRVEILQTGTNDKVLCMALNANEDVLVIGTSTGQIQ
ncbi:RING-TYPE E3 UBIQUITIN TRANSFERASE, partial [Salix purpurea]